MPSSEFCRKDKEIVKVRAEKLLKEKKTIDPDKYFELLWGNNLQHVCLFCHDLTRGKEKLLDTDLLKDELETPKTEGKGKKATEIPKGIKKPKKVIKKKSVPPPSSECSEELSSS